MRSAQRGSRRRRPSFTKGDSAALVVGTALVLSMLLWFSWSAVQNMAMDRAVAAGKSPAPVQGH